jgi:lipid-A-disaccharide synthase
VLKGDTYGLLSIADAALVTSGTATLETALFGVPEVVCYLGSPISYAIAKRIIKIKYISLVNLIMDKQVVEELIQHELSADNIAAALERVLSDTVAIQHIKEDYFQLNQLLKAGGKASEKAASIIDAMVK